MPPALADGRNGLQLFVKDRGSRSQYGKWQNLNRCGNQTVSLELRPQSDAAFTDSGFDASAVRVVGLKIGLGDASVTSYVGPLQLREFTIAPPVGLSPEATLPAASSRPSLVGRSVVARDGKLLVDSAETFIVGGNWRVVDYGQTFGVTKWFPRGNGVSKHAGFVRCELDRFRRAGVQWLRVGLIDDGRAVLDAQGRPLPSLQTFYDDVGKFLDLAEEEEIGIELSFADFLVAAPLRRSTAWPCKGGGWSSRTRRSAPPS